jgi:exodeoxyribonuclease VII large subunit
MIGLARVNKPPLPTVEQPILSVSELNQISKSILENSLGVQLITGEISNLATPSSGHRYFSLKDDQAQVRCALFKRNYNKPQIELKNGQQVIVQANVSLYAARGDYQLIVNEVTDSGTGVLQIQFEKLKRKLFNQGLFDPKHKTPLPHEANTIGVITSSSGAALQDILKVLKRRFPAIRVIIYPSLVQGQTASKDLINAIQTANQRNESDLLLLSRGGGSIEDLYCFNDEALAHAIFNSTLPIVTGIGHEIDITIADLAADFRAATPSAAAECVSPDKITYLDTLSGLKSDLLDRFKQYISNKKFTLQNLSSALQHPKDKIRENAQTLDQIEVQLQQQIANTLLLNQESIRFYASQLNTLNPLNTLKRGYAIVYDNNNNAISSAAKINSQQELRIKLQDGDISVITK